MLKVCRELLHIVENLLEILFNHCQNPGELDISHSRNYVISYGMILIAYQNGELDVEPLHHCG